MGSPLATTIMDMDKFVLFFRKRIEPFIALGVLVILLILAYQLYTGNNLREEISQNCGWGEEKYRCFCEKSEAIGIMNKMNNNITLNLNGDLEYVEVGR